ncbi:hypothetical protein U1299_10275 [Enterococcus cecorum]|uniref:Uncharacterized protein n=2 Tax=Enterococcus cecorum TaxID=44008 RepID=S1RRK9_9ENTE|nr:hypothetical protein [Enterococcus cecorum]EOX19182.1 hypothetical protein I567_00937 [Enterococcus cecorum DSM 20682 = ATCC 43198]ESK61089.1 hypothetical protein OMO_01148 [Enterococcus cecorum DSM 20682 = ATCC 43198]MCJ0535009.1 hypothetical protein [Enterococcus cecorum]MCJ0600138.1 hypothetical protein [Enterococcus cecorum]MDZ5505347.1 hypothetical protein [Enterococcus cecorum]
MKLEVDVSVEEYNSLSKIVYLMNFLLPEKISIENYINLLIQQEIDLQNIYENLIFKIENKI